MKIFIRKPLHSLIHIQFLRSSGRALNELIGNFCSKCTKQDDGTTPKSHTTASTCLHRFFASSNKGDSVAVANVSGDGENREVLNIQTEGYGSTSGLKVDGAEESVLTFDPPRKMSAKHRLKIWISSGRNGIIGRYGNKLELDVPKKLSAENVNTGWPYWLMNVAPEAVQGLLPRLEDSFEKLDKIGQGTYSSVYKARDLTNGKVVALKKVRFVNMDPESVRFMAREICILRKLNHPNVIKLEGIVASSGSQSLYLVFEYMEHDLVGLAATPGLKFTEPQVKCLLLQILSGLDHCHKNGVLHRDMKGSNLLIDRNGVLKIADFGLATIYDPDSQQPLTSRVATLWYRPPELLLGATKYGIGVDMWSTGCILAELLAGKPIMSGRTEVEQIHKIFKLCGSPSDEYWQKLKVPQTGMFKPRRQYRRCISENFKDFPHSALLLLDNLLAFEPEARGTAASTIQCDFFRTKPLACSPSDLPKCPPSKEYDTRLRLEEARRQKKVEGSKSVKPRNENHNISHAIYGSIKSKNVHTNSMSNNTNLNPEDDPRILSTGNYIDHREVPARKCNSVRVANSTSLRTRNSDILHPESIDIRNGMPASHKKHMGTKASMVKYRGKNRKIQYSGSLITPNGNIEDMLREHERNIQEAVRKARLNKIREL